MDYLQWKTQMRSEYFSRNVLAGNINRWQNITADRLFRKNGTTTIWIWKHWNNLMVNNCSKRNSNWEIGMIEWLELKSKFQWKRNIQLASILQIIKIIPKQIHIQLKKKNNNKKQQKKKKLRTAIEWDYGILPPSSIKGLPTDKNV